MEIRSILQGDEDYPPALISYLGPRAPYQLQLFGEEDLLKVPKVALFCSSTCPGVILNKAYDLANGLRQNLIAVISGFHSPVEREWLQILLNSATPIIRCPARELARRRMTEEDKKLSTKQRLLLLSFAPASRRSTEETAFYRNVCVAALAEKIFIAHAPPLSKTEALCRQILQWGKSVWTFEDGYNQSLLDLGAEGVSTVEFLAQISP